MQSSDPGRGFLGLVLDDYGTTWRKKVLLIAASRYMLDLFTGISEDSVMAETKLQKALCFSYLLEMSSLDV